MHARKLTALLAGGLLAAQLQGIFTAGAAAACPQGQTCTPPIVAIEGKGSVFLGVTSPGSDGGQSGGGGTPSGGAQPVGYGNGAGGSSPGPAATGGPPAPLPSFVITCGGGQAILTQPADTTYGILGVGSTPIGSCTAAPATPAAPGAPAVVVTPAQLARAAFGLLRMPAPQPSRYPFGTLRESGHPYTIVNANTWFWTDPATFQPVSRTVSAGGVSATATATPTALLFTPGDGSAPVSCPGPGSAWRASEATWIAPVSPQGCSYRYSRSSLGVGGDDQVTATYTITWRVTWSGSDGTSGVFNNLQTQTTSRFAVAEVQTVVVR